MSRIDKDKLLNDFHQYLSKIEEMFQVNAEQLHKTDAQCHAIVEQAADAIVILNAKLKIMTWNEGAEYVFGFKAEEVLERSIDEIVTRADVVNESAILSKKILAGEKIRSIETVRYAKDGTPKNVIISGTPVRNSAGKINTICLIYKDITDLKKAQVNLLQSEKQATLGIIAGSIGHELNNLVGGMMIYTHMLRDNPEDVAQVREFANILCEQLTHISVHAKNLLSLGKPVMPQFRKLDIIKLLTETTETLRISGLLKRFTIVNEFQDNLPLVQGDPHLLEQAIRNLEINSAHALEKKGTITIGAKLADPNFVEFYVKDDGPGIPDEIRDKIFEKFFTTKSDGQGTGLGLPIVKQIVDKHRGYLRLDSRKGKGARFIIGIPVATE